MRTRFGCCEGVLTLEAGSRFDPEPTKRVRSVEVAGGEVVLEGADRFVRIRTDVATVRLEKAAGRLLPLGLELRGAHDIPDGQQWEVSVTHRNSAGQIVGGASCLFVPADRVL